MKNVWRPVRTATGRHTGSACATDGFHGFAMASTDSKNDVATSLRVGREADFRSPIP